ncbi:helix-turn-helix domain-containing protein [Streptomyces sp. NBC_00984]|uniref:helix-turn-helix domain-containing protein n=1 Tax=Streptomyces sp. NBC_00984 TaxID=2903700 RepID=UPI003868E805|nr:helix-turn-helix domain-containing protein [Streptomyces sp. NBC_00984]
MPRAAARASELGVTDRTVRRWVADFRRHGEAGLVQRQVPRRGPSAGPMTDGWRPRWRS